MWIEGFSNQQIVGLIVGLALVVAGYRAYRLEVDKTKDAAQKVAAVLGGVDGLEAEKKAAALEKFFDLLKDLSLPKILTVSGIALVFWGLGVLNLSLSTIGG